MIFINESNTQSVLKELSVGPGGAISPPNYLEHIGQWNVLYYQVGEQNFYLVQRTQMVTIFDGTGKVMAGLSYQGLYLLKGLQSQLYYFFLEVKIFCIYLLVSQVLEALT